MNLRDKKILIIELVVLVLLVLGSMVLYRVSKVDYKNTVPGSFWGCMLRGGDYGYLKDFAINYKGKENKKGCRWFIWSKDDEQLHEDCKKASGANIGLDSAFSIDGRRVEGGGYGCTLIFDVTGDNFYKSRAEKINNLGK